MVNRLKRPDDVLIHTLVKDVGQKLIKIVQDGLSTRGAAAHLVHNLPVLFKNTLLGVILRFAFSSVIVLLFKAIAQCCTHSDIICLPA